MNTTAFDSLTVRRQCQEEINNTYRKAKRTKKKINTHVCDYG